MMQLTAKRKVIFMLGGLCVLGGAIYAAQWKWHFFPRMRLQNNSPVTTINPINNPPPFVANNSPNDSGDMRAILAANLFGQEGVAEKEVDDSGVVPKTQLPLELHGIVFIAKHPEQSVALIAQVGAAAKDYKAGETIEASAGWKVHSILAESVKIEHDGTVELLELPQSANAQPTTNPAIQVDGAQPPASDTPPPPPPDNSG